MGDATLIRFGGHTLDTRLRRLTLGASGDPVPLGSRALSVLLHLATHAGLLVSKADLMQAGWPDVTVEENSLAQCVSSIRKALGPAASHIVTEAGRGYRFVAESQAAGGRGRDQGRRTTDNDQAYRLFISGWSAMTAPGAESVRLAIDRLEKAVELDPGFAVAHAHLGTAYACLGTFGFVRPRSVIAQARAPVLRALELDPLLPEAHAELGHQQALLDLDPATAAKSAQRALDLDPNSVAALAIMGGLSGMLGRIDESLAYFRRAQIAEPLAPNASLGVGAACYFNGRYREAIAMYEAALELNPNFDLARRHLGRAFLRLGEAGRAIAMFETCKLPTVGGEADLPAAHAVSGRTTEARAALEKLKATTERYVSAYDVATIHAALGEAEEALTWLEQAFDERAPLTWGMKSDPALACLWGEPRFQALLGRMGVR